MSQNTVQCKISESFFFFTAFQVFIIIIIIIIIITKSKVCEKKMFTFRVACLLHVVLY
jgi:hypothetical protein